MQTTLLAIGVLGFLLWWGGYFWAMRIAWQAGARQLGIMVAAGVAGVCGCFGLPILAYFWSKVQTHTMAAVVDGPDDAPVPVHMKMYRYAAGIAIVGLVIQLVVGRLL